VNLMVKGRQYVHEGDPTLRGLLEGLGEESPYVVPRINGKVLERRDFENVEIADGDQVDLLYIMGGGETWARP
jgi:thiamine biosynthesis protein ThiS